MRGVIHLLRDPRSFAASSKRKDVPVDQAALQWSALHRAISRVTRLMGERVIQLRYEEFCAAPEQHLLRLQSWMGVDPEPLLHPFSPGRHWVGNRTMREFDGRITLRESWRETLSAREGRDREGQRPASAQVRIRLVSRMIAWRADAPAQVAILDLKLRLR